MWKRAKNWIAASLKPTIHLVSLYEKKTTDILGGDGFPLGADVQPGFAGKRYISEKKCPDQNVELVSTQYTSCRTINSDQRCSNAERSTEKPVPARGIFPLSRERKEVAICGLRHVKEDEKLNKPTAFTHRPSRLLVWEIAAGTSRKRFFEHFS